ncbi:hypothetical protein [Arthrobacter sp. ISL-30]|uniref:hypothetical protein n=1 Tax=Arthrobacter sp. ISL-30 TaxID=2819109 RepID=UPI001BE8A333|nr:hypothetical protein [Arthrobacter sp. ISL-30]MBT2512068.1 hypothetical protein [Arthrobacter sp. ISL-30]
MSAAAARNIPSVVGNTARALPAEAPGTGSPGSDAARRQRTPLSLVRNAPGKRRAPFVVFCFAVLAAALLTVLVLNISVSTAQYQLVELKGDAATLTKQNQDLTQKVQNYEAPQNLAAKAAELGMVASTVKGQIDLKTLIVSGKATPAIKADNPGAVIPAPAVAGQLSVVPPPSIKEALENRKPVDKPADKSAEKSDKSAEKAADKEASAADKNAPQLNGGSVPVPQQKAPGQ